jgi:hypothetical protein
VVHVKQSIRNSTGVRNKISDVKLKNGTLIWCLCMKCQTSSWNYCLLSNCSFSFTVTIMDSITKTWNWLFTECLIQNVIAVVGKVNFGHCVWRGQEGTCNSLRFCDVISIPASEVEAADLPV